MITQILENDDKLLENVITFQQDDASPHFDIRLRNFLNKRFPICWIRRSGPVECQLDHLIS